MPKPRRDVAPPASRRRAVTKTAAADVLGEQTMGFFGILAVALALASVVLHLPDAVDRALDVCQWAIVGLFGVEYVVALVRAPDRRSFVLSWWRILDLVIVFGPFVSLLVPTTGDAAFATPVLRVLRVAVFTARLGERAAHPHDAAEVTAPAKGETRITVVAEGESPREASWREVTERLVKPLANEWFHASGLDRTHLAELARDAGIVPSFVAHSLGETSFPRVEVQDRFSALFTWVPSFTDGEQGKVDRNGVLLLATDHGVLTVAQRAVDLQAEVVATMDDVALPGAAFPGRSILAFVKVVLRRYEAVSTQLEHEARALELLPVRDGRPEFFEQAFHLQRQV